jgi:AraC-like DNA-binding protein
LGATSFLLKPPRDLSGCLFAGIVRDTRGVDLSDQDRLNFFPASPLVCVTHVKAGELRLVPPGAGLDAARVAPPLPRSLVTPPQNESTVSWSPGPVLAISVGIYPDAWAKFTGACEVVGLLERAFERCDDVHAGWERFCRALAPSRQAARGDVTLPAGTGAPQIRDWARTLVARAALSGAGRSVRSLERRLRRISGQTRRSLVFYEDFENLHRVSTREKGAPLAELAVAANFADQSHMGRAVRRATGFSPARLNQLIETKEAFWCYRLLGQRF